MFKKGIGVIVPLFDATLCLLMLHSPFFLSSTVTRQGEEEDLIVWEIM